jgi:hypothetical protein
MLLPAERAIVLNLAESPRNDTPLRRLGHSLMWKVL